MSNDTTLVSLLNKGVKNPSKVSPYLKSKLINRVCSSIISQNNSNEEINIIWQDDPEKFEIKMTKTPNEFYEHVGEKLFKSKSNPHPSFNSSEVYYKPHLRFVGERKNITAVIHSDFTEGKRRFRYILIDNSGKVVGPNLISSDEENEKRLVKLTRNITSKYGCKKITKVLFENSNKTFSSQDSKIDLGLFLSSRWSHNYGHWLLQDIPKLHRAQKYEEKTGQYPKLIVGSTLSDWNYDVLDMFNVNKSDLIEIDSKIAYFENLVVTDVKNVNSYDHDVCKEDLNWLASEAKSNINTLKGERFSSRIFLSRKNCGERMVHNYSEVEALLHKFGFETYYPEELSFEDQIALFDQAEIVVGVVGSAFANIIFSNDIDVICFYPYRYSNPKYRIGPWIPGVFCTIANAVGHEWIPLYSCELPSEPGTRTHSYSVKVELEELRKVLTERSEIA